MVPGGSPVRWHHYRPIPVRFPQGFIEYSVNLWESDLALFEAFPEEEAQAADSQGRMIADMTCDLVIRGLCCASFFKPTLARHQKIEVTSRDTTNFDAASSFDAVDFALS